MSARYRIQTAVLIATAVVLALALGPTPVGAHVTQSWTHLRDGHVKPFTDGRYYTKAALNTADSAINQSGDPVHWTNLKGVPFGVDEAGNMQLSGALDVGGIMTEGDITAQTGQFLDTLNAGNVTGGSATFDSVTGTTYVGSPTGTFANLTATGFLKIPTFVSMGGGPPASDCDTAAESGSIMLNTLTSDLYVCNNPNWVVFPNS
jgi:hypothetical protein